jgi:plasmid replication initiation protein
MNKKRPVEKRRVTQSNDLIVARYKLSSVEQKIIEMVITQITPVDKDFKEYVFKTKDILKTLKLGEKNYRYLYDASKSLLKKPYELEQPNGATLIVNVISSAEFSEDNSMVAFTFDPKLKPYLLQLRESFTSYYLENVLCLKSEYSIRIYKMLKQCEKMQVLRKSVGELKEMLKIENEYPLFGNFRQFVLEAAKKELEEKTDIRFTYDMEKKGKKIEFIYFKISHNPSAEERAEIDRQKRLLALPEDAPERLAVREQVEKSIREAREKTEREGELF